MGNFYEFNLDWKITIEQRSKRWQFFNRLFLLVNWKIKRDLPLSWSLIEILSHNQEGRRSHLHASGHVIELQYNGQFKHSIPYLSSESPCSHYVVEVAFAQRHVGLVTTVIPSFKMTVIEVSMTFVHHKMVNKALVSRLNVWFELKTYKWMMH